MLDRCRALAIALAAVCGQAALLAQANPGVDPEGLVREPAVVRKAATYAERRERAGEATNGFYVDFGNMITGAGWISAGPGYRHWFAGNRVFTEASGAISWRAYKTARARIELPGIARQKLLVGSEIRWNDFTQVDTFGPGPQSLESNDTEYRLKSTEVLGYATVKPIQWLAVNGGFGRVQPSIFPPAGTFRRTDRPDTRELFSSDVVYTLARQPAFLHGDVSVVVDTRDFTGHPTRGSVARAAAAGYSDRTAGLFSFRGYELEGAQFASFADSRLVLALHGWLIGTSTSDGSVVPFYLQPSIGGQNTLRGYSDYRFHDRNAVVVNAEARVPLMTHLDAAAFVDAGNVSARVRDLDLKKRSYGAGVRFHSRRQTYARFDLAHSPEGWEFVLRLNDPLSLRRMARRTAAIPFVP